VTVRVRNLVPMAQVRSIPQSIGFYRLLGFEVTGDFTPPDATEPTWASLVAGGGRLMVARAEKAQTVAPESVLFYVYCDDVAEMRKELVASGLGPGPIQTPFYAPRGEFELRDPDGYLVVVTHT
jgi:catechol 2,3-dioxygenase-like lactoylglutathione lyase family enzyme